MSGASDLIITDAALYTDGLARSGELAVKDGRIAAVGTPGELRELAGTTTEILSLPGRLVVPGFQDGHVHPAFGGRNLLRVTLDHVTTVDAYLEAIAAYAAANPDEPWITGGGWAMYLFPGGAPHREELDRIVPDRPVFLMNRDVHGAWVNSRALEIAGITKDTPDPWDGRIERDPVTGEPTGTLHEGAAYTFRDRFVPRTDQGEWRRALLVAQQRLHALGITGWQDAWVTPDLLEAYGALDAAGELTMRVSASLWWDRHRGDEQVDELVERGRAATNGNIRATTVKIMTRRRGRRTAHARSWSPTAIQGRIRRGIAAWRTSAEIGSGRRSSRSTRMGSRCTCTRSATARVATPWTRSRRRAQRTVRATIGITWRICRSSIPMTCRGSARWA